jgi:hypothetical protein
MIEIEKGEGWRIVSTLISPARKSAPVRTSLSSPAERNHARSVLTGASSSPIPHPAEIRMLTPQDDLLKFRGDCGMDLTNGFDVSFPCYAFFFNRSSSLRSKITLKK